MHFHVPYAEIFAAPLLLALWTFRGPLRHSAWPALLAIAYFGRISASNALGNIRAPRTWDFGCFWLYGHIAALHKNIYDPATFTAFPLPFAPSKDFIEAVLKVGFPYPPPTIALFLPLGHIESLTVGLVIWYAVEFAALAIAAWYLARTFMPAERWAATALVIALVLALPATQSNIGDAQTNFLVLLLVALSLAGRATVFGAIWPIVAIWIKPFVAALFVVDVVRAHWRRLAIAGGATVVSFVAAALALGPHTFLTYFRSNPAGREPAFTFVESVNQSLLATVLRAHSTLPTRISALHEPAYLALALVFVGVTAYLCARAPRDSDLAFALALLLGLLIYPATLTSYGVVVIVPLLILWRHREQLPGKAVTFVAIVALVSVMQGLLNFGFGANVALWLSSALVLAAQVRLSEPAAIAQPNRVENAIRSGA